MERLAAGETVREIAESWGRSVTVVYWELEKVRVELGAKTNVQAAVIWARNGRS